MVSLAASPSPPGRSSVYFATCMLDPLGRELAARLEDGWLGRAKNYWRYHMYSDHKCLVTLM